MIVTWWPWSSGSASRRRVPVTGGGEVAQVWRGGCGRQAPLARLLAGTDVVAVDDVLGRRAGWRARNGWPMCVTCVVLACPGPDGGNLVIVRLGRC